MPLVLLNINANSRLLWVFKEQILQPSSFRLSTSSKFNQLQHRIKLIEYIRPCASAELRASNANALWVLDTFLGKLLIFSRQPQFPPRKDEDLVRIELQGFLAGYSYFRSLDFPSASTSLRLLYFLSFGRFIFSLVEMKLYMPYVGRIEEVGKQNGVTFPTCWQLTSLELDLDNYRGGQQW